MYLRHHKQTLDQGYQLHILWASFAELLYPPHQATGGQPELGDMAKGHGLL